MRVSEGRRVQGLVSGRIVVQTVEDWVPAAAAEEPDPVPGDGARDTDRTGEAGAASAAPTAGGARDPARAGEVPAETPEEGRTAETPEDGRTGDLGEDASFQHGVSEAGAVERHGEDEASRESEDEARRRIKAEKRERRRAKAESLLEQCKSAYRSRATNRSIRLHSCQGRHPPDENALPAGRNACGPRPVWCSP